uniref:Uncharacterized protein LOC111133831 n=1 Tax=Crassostrea virginica TaxID=6565 RepID=A0A8B8EDP8_CRAVI|nr:uncharacterized protein LOC111133831 [Crassostrea virginica]
MQTLLKKDYVRQLRDTEGCTIDSSTENKYIELIKRIADEEKTTRGLLQELTSNEIIVMKPKQPKKRKLEESIDNASIELLNTMVDLVHTTTSESEIDHLYESVVEFIIANKEETEDILLGHLYEKLKEKIKSYANLQGPNQMRILARFLKFSLTFKKVYRASMECSNGSILLHVTFSSRNDYDLYKIHLRNGRIGRQILELFLYPPFLGSFGLKVVDIEISLNDSLLTPHKDMKQDSRLLEAVYVGMCYYVGTHTQVNIRREVMGTKEEVMRPVWIMRGYDMMESGSFREGFRLPQSDLDVMLWHPDHKVICDISQISLYRMPEHTVILMAREDLPPGFTRLKLMTPSVDPNVMSASIFINGEIYISALPYKKNYFNLNWSNKAMLKTSMQNGSDCACCFRSNHWPDLALPWIQRCQGKLWPSESVLSMIIEEGCHVIPIISLPEEDNKWRISFSGAEQKLIYSMNHSQFLCYGLLKVFLKEVINSSSCLCSYHMKTILFWVIHSENGLDWVPDNLLTCFWTCFKVLLSWVYKGECPNFFIPENNMFRVKVVGHTQDSLFEHLNALYSQGISCLLESPKIGRFLNLVILNSMQIFLTDETRLFSEVHDVDLCLFREFIMFSEIIVLNLKEVLRAVIAVGYLQKSRVSLIQKLTMQHILSELFKHLSNLLSSQTTATTKELKDSDKKALNMIKVAVKIGFASDIVYLALQLYRNCLYEQSLRCLQKAHDRMSKPHIIYRGHLNEERYKRFMVRVSLSNRMSKCLIYDIRLHNEYNYIDELVPEQEANKANGGSLLLIPPLVMVHMLFVLNHHRLGDTVRSQQSLQDLHTLLLSDDGTRVPDKLRDISWQILGICQQTCGDYVGSVFSFLCSLRQFPQNCIQRATMLRLLIINYKLFVARIISVSTSTNRLLMIDNK